MPGSAFTIPNLITVARFAAVPLVVYALVAGHWMLGFSLFVFAGVSDAVDGFIARHFGQGSVLGAYLDPLADKALIVAVYATLTFLGYVPIWLFVLVLLRDVAIVATMATLFFGHRRMSVRPLFVSKLNTGFQLALAGWILAAKAFDWPLAFVTHLLIGTVVALTVLSSLAYGYKLLLHMRDS